MSLRKIATWSAVVVVSAAGSFVGVPSAALAQSDCACVLAPPASGPVGAISQANGNVFVTGASGLEGGGVGTPVGPGDVVSTGGSSSASLSLAGGCNIAIGPSSTVSITPVGQNLCVRVTEEVLGTRGEGGGGNTAGLVAGGAIAGTAAVIVGVGLSQPVSR
jgi:hypothetical protein